MESTAPHESSRARVTVLDTARGLAIVSMVLFHACYDLAYLAGYDLPWFTQTIVQNAWSASISWTFLFLAGWMTSLSRSNIRRGLIYAAIALLVYIATSIAGVDTAISFGIIYCMAACTLLWACAAPMLSRVPSAAGIVASFALFALTYGIPRVRYGIAGLAWLGFPSEAFSSGDYYPLLPYCFMYLAGAFAARLFMQRAKRYPAWMLRDWCHPLTVIGTKSLAIYVIHQPVLLALVLALPR